MIQKSKIMNKKALDNIFGGVPSFNNSELLEVQIKRDGPTLFLRFLLHEVVKNKPKRWDKYDVIYLDISFLNIKDLIIEGVVSNNYIDSIEINELNDEGILEIKYNNDMYIRCLFSIAYVEKIAPGIIGTF